MKVNLIRRRGFTIIELFISMVIIAIFTSFITSNISSQSQTAKSEAEKLAAYITDLTRKADRRHMSFVIKFHSGYTYYYWVHGKDNDKYTRGYLYHNNPEEIDKTKYTLLTDTPILTPGFSLSGKFGLDKGVYEADIDELSYNSNKNEFDYNGTLTLTRTLDSTRYNIVIDQEGRIRTEETE